VEVQSTLAIERSLVESYGARRAEPSWMVERRAEALRLFEETPMPQWDRTDLSGLDMEAYVQALRRALESAPAPAPVVDLASPKGVDGSWPAAVVEELQGVQAGSSVIVHVAAGIETPVRSARWLDPELARRGVRLMSLTEALAQMPDLVRAHFMTRAVPASQGKFMALHGAACDVGTVLFVPRGVQLEQPIQIVTWMDAARPLLFPHTLIVLEDEARVTVIESQMSAGAEAAGGVRPLVAGAVEIVAGPSSRIDYVALQTWGTHVQSFTNRRAVQDRDSQVEWILGEFGCALTRGEFESALEGSGASSHTVLVFFADGQQHLDLLNSMDHRGTHTESDIAARGVLNGQARGIYRAVTHIRSGARESGAYQKGNILVLSPDARADANPSVVVEESEVQRAGHAATVGQVDREQLFYLMSRGIPEKVAIALIVEGFLRPVLDRIPSEAVQERIRRIVTAKLGAA